MSRLIFPAFILRVLNYNFSHWHGANAFMIEYERVVFCLAHALGVSVVRFPGLPNLTRLNGEWHA